MLLAVISGFVVATIAPALQRRTGEATGWLLGVLPLALFGYFLYRLAGVMQGEPLTEFYPWVPFFGVGLSFLLDGLSLTMALVITGIGTLVVIYTGGYLHGHPQIGRFYAFTLMFMASMLGVVLAGNILTIFVFWELTSLSSYFLIGFNHEREQARAAAWQALLVTGAGGLALMAGLVLLGMAAGSFELADVLRQGDAVRNHSAYGWILGLVLLGAFTKSAQFPFHFWLPNAMEAPTPASAYLHSATMVKAGVYLLARLTPVLSGTWSWAFWVTLAGVVTMAGGAYLALHQTYLKRILAYTTVSALGALVMLLGIGGEHGVAAAVVFLLAHALYKAALFLMAGAVDHETGERDVQHLGGLARKMPVTAAGATVAALSMAGIPLFFGFIGKEVMYDALWHAEALRWLILAAAVLTNMIFVAVAGILILAPFYGAEKHTPKHPHEAPAAMWLGPVLLGAGSLALGLLPQHVGHGLLGPAASAVLGVESHLHLALWHGLSVPLLLSVITLAGGVALYLFRDRVRTALAPVQRLAGYGPNAWYEWIFEGGVNLAKWQTKVLQTGYLRIYLMIIMIFTIGAVGWGIVTQRELEFAPIWRGVRYYELGLAAIITAAIAAAVHSRTRLAAIASLGVVGYGVSLVFVLFSAPDLAMTQLVIETLTVVLFVLVFYHLPSYAQYTKSVPARARDLVIALSGGALMAALVLVAAGVQISPSISRYFVENSHDLAHGNNIVNVILVDFRGFDTLGEITVLAVAGIGAYSLLKLRLGKKEKP